MNRPKFANLQHAINSIPADFFWLIGKGKISDGEPMYAVQIMDQESSVLAEAEDDNLIDAISQAVGALFAHHQ